MDKPTWTYNLRIVERRPEEIRMDRFGEYVRTFAELLGLENQPSFDGILNQSTGICARIPVQNQKRAHLRLVESRTEPDSKPAKIVEKLEKMMGEDGLTTIELKDASDNILYKYVGIPPVPAETIRLKHEGTIDGQVIGIVGSDATMHLHVRDAFGVTVRLTVKDEELAKALVSHFKGKILRITAHGFWARDNDEWAPESSCTVLRFEELDTTPVGEIFESIKGLKGNGWQSMEAPQAYWESIRGIN